MNLLRVNKVAKAFGPTQAIKEASLELKHGEIHCVVGENGSGKSTLVKILTGVYTPDSGTLEMNGEPINLSSPRDSIEAGVATVFQEVLVVEPRSVLENIWLGDDGFLRDGRPEAERVELATEVLGQLLGDPPPLDLPVEALGLSDRQACSIARALVRRPSVLILDEATAAVDVETRDRLFVAIRELAKQGTSTIFISHRLDEIQTIADKCTVMRSGNTVATLDRGDINTPRLVQLMTGSEHLIPESARKAVERTEPGEVVLRAQGLQIDPRHDGIDFEARAGELVGLAGLEGHGQDDFLKALWGGGFSGTVEVDGTPIESTLQASELGVAYVPRERRAEAIFESKTIRENFGLPSIDKDTRSRVILYDRTRERLSEWSKRLGIVLGSPEDAITTLSGGNQQKVVIARWLAMNPRVMLLNDPTRGIDIGAKRDLYELLTDLASKGMAIVMLSTELDEIVELVDRVLVFREYQVERELTRAEISRESLVAAYFGRSHKDAKKQAAKRKPQRRTVDA